MTAHEEQDERVVLIGFISYDGGGARPDSMAAAVSRRRRANSLRRWSVMRREAT